MMMQTFVFVLLITGIAAVLTAKHGRMSRQILAVGFMLTVTALPASAQKIPAGMRNEIGESETDRGEFSIFSYKDTDEDGTFGYYLGLGRVTPFLGADEILGMQIDNVKETCIFLGSTYDEAYAKLGSIIDLYDEDVDTTTEFQGRETSNGSRLGESNTSTCVVRKKLLGGKHLEFIFTSGEHKAHTYLPKSVVKELRMSLKMDKKLHPKQHR